VTGTINQPPDTAKSPFGLSVSDKRQYIALDGLRGLAALCVVFYHVRWTNHVTFGEFFKHGYLAVDLFFILSGFIIYAGYSKQLSNRTQLQRFICLRFFRVYPLHIAVLCAFVAVEFAKLWGQQSGVMVPEHMPFTDATSIRALVANVFLVHSLDILDGLTWNTPSWSISCEFAAYILFSIAMFAGLFRRKSAFALAAILATTAYLTLAFVYKTLDVTFNFGIVRCLSGFVFGMLIFELAKGPIGARLRAQSQAVVGACEIGLLAGLVIAMCFAPGAAIVVAIPIFVGAVFILQDDRGPIAKALSSAPAQFLGKISYSIYMVHFFVIVIVFIVLKRIAKLPIVLDPITQVPTMQVNPWIGDVLVATVLLLIVLLSAFTYAVVEQPTRLFGRRLAANTFGKAGSVSNGQHVYD
jgi:peptidoglycan/LPS O-acetylase OafA/YrhL